jgi:hypothetical protein
LNLELLFGACPTPARSILLYPDSAVFEGRYLQPLTLTDGRGVKYLARKLMLVAGNKFPSFLF